MKLGPDMYQLNTFNTTKMRVSMNGRVEGGRNQKQKIIRQNFVILAFFIFFTLCFYSNILLLGKTSESQNQQGFIICQRLPLEAFGKKKCLGNFTVSHCIQEK